MHFSIPDTTHCRDSSGSFVTYNIHINGSFHCSLRYRQLYQFHLQLKSTFGGASLCPFPPKKLFALSTKQLEERRSSLEKFLQIASQDSEIVASALFNDFLLSAQQDTHLSAEAQSKTTSSEANGPRILEVHQQLNSVQTTVRLSVDVSENSATVLRRWATVIGLGERLLPYFCLYLVRRVETPASVDFRVVRRLANYESPYLTLVASERRLKNASERVKVQNGTSSSPPSFLVMIRKSYWDAALDEDLFGDRVALNVLYLIAHHEVEKGHVVASKEVRHRLTALQAMGEKVEYLRLARTLKFYGYVHFEPCTCDHLFALATLNGAGRADDNSIRSSSRQSSPVKICAGNQELVVRLVGSNEETVFRVIRIKCWRLTTSSSSGPKTSNDSEDSGSGESSQHRYELSFEYLVKQGTLLWICISSPQAVLISTCLQAMVEEMLVRREGKKFRSEGLSLHYHTSPSFSSAVTTNSTLNSTSTSQSSSSTTSNDNYPNGQPEGEPAVKGDKSSANSSMSSSMSTTSSSNNSSPIEIIDSSNGGKNPANGGGSSKQVVRYSRLVENNVFDEIGEEDL